MAEDKTLPQPPNWLSLYNATKPDSLVVIGPDRSITWAELYVRSRALAKNLYRLGLRPGNQAAIMTYNLPWSIEFAAALYWLDVGVIRVGYRMQAPEIEFIIENSDSKLFFFLPEFADRILSRRDCYPGLLSGGFIDPGLGDYSDVHEYEDLFNDVPDVDLENLPPTDKVGDSMIFTSGTTGLPKGAARKTDFATRPEVLNYFFATIEFLEYGPDEVHVVCCPQYHSGPFYFGILSYILGGTMVYQPKWNPEEFLRLVDEHKVTSTHFVPTMVSSLLQLPDETVGKYDLSSLRAVICGAAPLFPRYKLAFLDRFGPVLHEYYGATESGVNTFIGPEEMRERPESVGRVFANNELKIFDTEGNEVPDGDRGILYVHSPILMDGYYKNEEATRDCFIGKYMTAGDVAVRDEEGYIYIVDRVKDMIIRGGVNIYPAEVEAVLSEAPGVLDTAVVGKPDPYWGEIVAAFVVKAPEAEVNEEEIKSYCSGRMAPQKIPVLIVFIDEIPRTPTGKVLKRELRERIKEIA